MKRTLIYCAYSMFWLRFSSEQCQQSFYFNWVGERLQWLCVLCICIIADVILVIKNINNVSHNKKNIVIEKLKPNDNNISICCSSVSVLELILQISR